MEAVGTGDDGSPVPWPASLVPTVGSFERVYDPSVADDERWYINDHTFVREASGTWHLVGITHAEPAAPFDELHFAHATAPDLHGPWKREPYALSTDPLHGEHHLWAPHIVEHDDLYWMFYCAGGRPSPGTGSTSPRHPTAHTGRGATRTR